MLHYKTIFIFQIKHFIESCKSNEFDGDSWCCLANLDISVRIHAQGDQSIFECVNGFEKSRSHVRETWRVHFCTQRRALAAP